MDKLNKDLVAEIVKFNSQTAGRDRLFRLLQYGSRLVWWSFQRCSGNKELVLRLKNLEFTLSSGRKLLRLGRFLDVIYSSLRTISLPDVTLRLTLTLSRINMALYLLSDNILWMNQVGIINVSKEKWYKISNKFWLYAIVMSLVRDVYEIFELLVIHLAKDHSSQQRFPAFPFNNLSVVSLQFITAHKALILDFVKNFADFWIPYSSLGFVDLQPGLVGLFGVISSVAALVPMFNPTYTLVPN